MLYSKNRLPVYMTALLLVSNQSVFADSGTAQGQESAAAPVLQQRGGLEEVVVTARKRTEPMQEAPIAVSSFSEQQLHNVGAESFADIAKLTPGLHYRDDKGGTGPYIRGVGQRYNSATFDPAVAIYIDDIYIGRPDAIPMIADIQRVEVLRGPQGTLFGRNATGGAINIYTNEPGDEFAGGLIARVGNYNKQQLDLVLNVPLTTSLSARISLAHSAMDSYIKVEDSEGNAIDNTIDDLDRQSVYTKVKWRAPTQATDIGFVFSRYSAEENRNSGKCLYANQGGSATLETIFDLFLGFQDSSYQQVCEENSATTNIDFHRGTNSFVTFESTQYALTASHEFDTMAFDYLQFKSITAFRKVKKEELTDPDGSSLDLIIQAVDEPRVTRQFTQELQLSGALIDDRLRFVSGLYYWREAIDPDDEIQSSGPLELSLGSYHFVFFRDDLARRKIDNYSMAAFTQFDFLFNDSWSATMGLRYTTETRELKVSRYDNLPAQDVFWPGTSQLSDFPGLAPILLPLAGLTGLDLAGLNQTNIPLFIYSNSRADNSIDSVILSPQEQISAGLLTPPQSGKSEFDAWTPLFSFSYHLNEAALEALNADTGLVYITYSKGFRAGGILSDSNSHNGSTFVPSIDTFKPEHVTNIELGLKLDISASVRTNIAVFRLDYIDQQVSAALQNVNNPAQPIITIINAGDSTISGIESEILYAPNDRLAINLMLQYTEAKYNRFYGFTYPRCTVGEADCGSGIREEVIDRADEDQPFVSAVNAYFSVDYTLYLPWFRITPHMEVVYDSGFNTHLDRGSYESEVLETPSYSQFNGQLRFDFFDKKSRVVLGINNITDRRVTNSGLGAVDSLGAAPQVTFNAPRTYQVEYFRSF